MEPSVDATAKEKANVVLTVDESKKLLWKLMRLSNNLQLPYAVVKPVQNNSAVSNVVSPIKIADKSATNAKDTAAVDLCRKRKSVCGSEEERIQKRKKMNRLSAQSARDRKKKYVEDLESRVAALEAKNKVLIQENQHLLKYNCSLEVEKAELEKRLASSNIEGDRIEGPVKVAGSAVPTVSQQKKPTSMASLLLQLWTTLQLTSWTASVMGWTHHNQSPRSLPSVLQLRHHHLGHQQEIFALPLEEDTWWGPHQASWNPPPN